MTRPIRRAVACVLSVSITVLAPGFDAVHAFAADIVARPTAATPALSLALPRTDIGADIPVAAVNGVAPVPPPSEPVSALIEQTAAPMASIADIKTSPDDLSAGGKDIQAILGGGETANDDAMGPVNAPAAPGAPASGRVTLARPSTAKISPTTRRVVFADAASVSANGIRAWTETMHLLGKTVVMVEGSSLRNIHSSLPADVAEGSYATSSSGGALFHRRDGRWMPAAFLSSTVAGERVRAAVVASRSRIAKEGFTLIPPSAADLGANGEIAALNMGSAPNVDDRSVAAAVRILKEELATVGASNAVTLVIGAAAEGMSEGPQNLWIVPGSGPVATLEVLRGNRPAAAQAVPVVKRSLDEALPAVLIVVIAIIGMSFFIYEISQFAVAAEALLREKMRLDPDVFGSFHGTGAMLGTLAAGAAGVSSSASLKDSGKVPSIESAYSAALPFALRHVAELGGEASNLRVTGGRFSRTQGGDRWAFDFFLPGEGLREKITFAIVVSLAASDGEERFDFHSVESDAGRGYANISAATFAENLRIDAESIAETSPSEARSLALDVRWTDGNRAPALVMYSVLNAAGRELYAVDAATGEKIVARKSSAWRGAAMIVALIALVGALYTGMFYAGTHSPAATSTGAEVLPPSAAWNSPFPNF